MTSEEYQHMIDATKSEDDIQAECVEWFRMKFPQSIIAHVPNGGSRHKLEAFKFKRTGVLAGFPDLIVIHNGKVIFIEMKNAKGKQSESQKEMQKKIEEQGFSYYLCRNKNSFIELFSNS